MAIKTNTFVSYSAKGIREDLSDMIYDISPTETPFIQMAGKGKAKNTLFEWQVDSLASADAANAQIEGDDVDSVGYDAVAATTRIGNYAQISRKSVVVSDTHEVLDKAGRKSEMAYQLAKRAKELKRDMETICLSNQACAAGNSTTARKTGSFLAFLKTNVDKEATGVNPVYTTTPSGTRTDSASPRAFTEAILKSVISKVWSSGGNPKVLMVGPVNKAKASAFAGIAASRFNVKGNAPATIIGAADIYVSDFGNVEIVPNRFQRERDAFVIDPEYVQIDYLRPFKTTPMAKTGDAEKRLLVVEWGVRVKNELAHGLAADLTIT